MRQLKMSYPSSKRSPYSVEAPPTVAYWGPPGTGKTTTLMDVIEGELREGVPVSKIGGFTYRKDMADEFRERAAQTAGGVEGETWFKTTHAGAFALLDMTKDDTCDEDAQRQFCESYGYGWDGHSANAQEDLDTDGVFTASGSGDGSGPALLRARSWCLNLGLDVMDWRKVPLSDDERQHLSDTRVADFNREYDEWKAQEGLMDFDDMLVECVERELAPPVEVLIEDEFQDKTPLQVELYNVWARQADRVYVAGDPNQAIYTYQGTDPAFMQQALGLAEKREILDVSYRLGPDLVSYATQILRNGEGDLPDIIPQGGECSVERIPWSDYAHYASVHEDAETFHLVRANYMKKYVAGVLGDAGVPFEDNRSTGATWTSRQKNLYNGVAKAVAEIEGMAFGQEPTFDLSAAETCEVAGALPGSALTCAKGDVEALTDGGAQLEDLSTSANLGGLLTGNPFDGLKKRSSDTLVPSAVGSEGIQNRLGRAFANRNGDTIGDVSHSLSTIHAAKGQERDVVFLLDASTYTITNESPLAEEALVFYVGATRAADTLYIVEDSPASKYPTEVLP